MASYAESKQKAVQELIDKYTQDTLDNYVRATVKEAGIAKMNEGASAIEVADAIFDCIDKNFSGCCTMAEMCNQICPKSVLLVLRNEIITALK
jgi:hypothetical protein